MTSKTKTSAEPNTADGNTATKTSDAPAPAKAPSRLDQLEQLLTRSEGATLNEMTEATGWQTHSVRGAMAGALKKRGLAISSEKLDGIRRYRAVRPA